MSGFLQCLSHTPLIGKYNPAESVLDEISSYTREVRKQIENFDPQLVVLSAPDHFNGFFYDVMPPFCIGIEANSIGDYDTPKGPVCTDRDTAARLAEYCMEDDIDIAVSQRMQVDHGFAQPLDFLLGGIDKYPVIPIFINCVAPPLPLFKRTRVFGETVGKFCSTLGKRVLFLASGGLSHQPPLPEYATATEVVKLQLLGGQRNMSPEAREARTLRTIEAAKRFVVDQNTLHPLAPEWDMQFINKISEGNISALDDLKNDTVTEVAGASTHEVKTWVAAASAMSVFGPYESLGQYYRPIPEWIAGYGGFTAKSMENRKNTASNCDHDVKAPGPDLTSSAVTAPLQS